MADHRLAHRPRRRGRAPGSISLRRDQHAGVVGAEALGDQVGVPELVALVAADRLEADAERLEALLALLGEQPDDQAGVEAAGQQHADRDVGDQPPLDREPQRRRGRRPPSRAATSRLRAGSRT